MTKSEAKAILGAKTDLELAALLGIKRQAVQQWKEHIPELRRFQILELLKGE